MLRLGIVKTRNSLDLAVDNLNPVENMVYTFTVSISKESRDIISLHDMLLHPNAF